MSDKEKAILILGMGISGRSTFSALEKLGLEAYIYDENIDKLSSEIKSKSLACFDRIDDIDFNKIDSIIKSPGIPMENPIIKKALKAGIEVVTDLEFAYRLGINKNFIVITGTNGKTTTTSLVGDLFKRSGFNTHIVGNIGVGILDKLVDSKEDDYFIIEASSFQLENCSSLNPRISAILNLSPDHLNWHKTYENYVNAKLNLVRQQKDSYTVLNYDDELLRQLSKELESKIIFFSRKEVLDKGFYLKDGYLNYNLGEGEVKLLKAEKLNILGNHNIENALASIAMAKLAGIKDKTIVSGLRSFQGVEHRIEYVDTIDGVDYYNDSKGTNPEASMRAIEALEEDIIIILGGMDKGSSFKELLNMSKNKVKEIVVLGETKYKIKKEAEEVAFDSVYLVDTMAEAVSKASKLARSGDKILLSPACASWDMYDSFERRGEDFKEKVYSLKG